MRKKSSTTTVQRGITGYGINRRISGMKYKTRMQRVKGKFRTEAKHAMRGGKP